MKTKQTYVAFLRGINVGGHHKLAMAELRKALQQLKLDNIVTLLNSGNAIFTTNSNDPEGLEELISEKLEETFGFPVPTIIRKAATIHKLFNDAPFQDVEITRDIRLYISFLKKNTPSDLELPWKSPDNSFEIIAKEGNAILSILDLSISQTPKAMNNVEHFYGKDITTRNWKTIERIVNKL